MNPSRTPTGQQTVRGRRRGRSAAVGVGESPPFGAGGVGVTPGEIPIQTGSTPPELGMVLETASVQAGIPAYQMTSDDENNRGTGGNGNGGNGSFKWSEDVLKAPHFSAASVNQFKHVITDNSNNKYGF
jgi:hypothetical protein